MAACILASKFRASLVGSVIGDCLGAPFESDFPIAKSTLTNYFRDKLNPSPKKTLQVYPYTDDTAMTRSVAQSLIDHNGFNPEDMAKRFAEEFFKEPKRGYGGNVIDVFYRFRELDYKDVFTPAKEQFEGSGSYGNGAAMRIAPVALFSHNQDILTLVNLAKETSLLTHTHRNGYQGAILQSLAISLALNKAADTKLDRESFLNELILRMDELQSREAASAESDSINNAVSIPPESRTKLNKMTQETYSQRLQKVKRALSEKDLTPNEVAVLLGNDVSAPCSVPTAIYAFLRGMEPLDIFESDNPFVRTLYFSVAVGGDTDTIASMACSIAGAYYGLEHIPEELTKRCEGIELALKQAEDLKKIVENRKTG